MINFNIQYFEDGVEVRGSVTEKVKSKKRYLPFFINFFSKDISKNINIDDWYELGELRTIETICVLDNTATEDERLCKRLDDGEGYFLSNELVSSLTETQAKSINLAPTCPYTFKIDSLGDFHNTDFKVTWRFINRGKTWNHTRKGSFVESSEQRFRLKEPLNKISDLIEEFSNHKNTTFDQRIDFRSQLNSLIGINGQSHSIDNKSLNPINLHHASAFSIDIKDQNSMSIAPVLFNKEMKMKASQLKEQGNGEYIEEARQILKPFDSLEFQSQFRNKDEAKPTYLLTDSTYVFIDPALRNTLDKFKNVMTDSLEERQEFVKNPQKYLYDKIENDDHNKDDISIELEKEKIGELFIETREYSDRVVGFGIWSPPVIPIPQKETQKWTPETYAIYVKDEKKTIHIDKENINNVVETIKKACEEGRSSVDVIDQNDNPVTITITKETLPFFESLLIEKPNRPSGKEPNKIQKGSEYVILTKDNFETINYYANIIARSSQIKFSETDFLNHDIQLYNAQKEGVKWLIDAYNFGYMGALLADDMGTGKTVQTLTFLSFLKKYNSNREPILIVAPVSLLNNWIDESKKFLRGQGLGELCKIYGGNIKSFLKEDKKLDIDYIKSQFNWLLTTYQTMRDYHTSLAEIKFSCVIFDELQIAKNPKGRIYNACRALNSNFTVGLSGTPVENDISDLWTIMDILQPGFLGQNLKDFYAEYNVKSSTRTYKGIPNNENKLKKLSDRLLKEGPSGEPPLIKRRLKEEVAKLPIKTIKPAYDTSKTMPQDQSRIYLDWSNKYLRNVRSKIEVIHKFRDVSLHPYDPRQAELGQISKDDYIKQSARLSVLFKELDKIYDLGDKVLIFLESRAMQPVVAGLIKYKYKIDTPMIINGAVSGKARSDKVRLFQESESGFDVMIISPKAGGVGLNLTRANHVIHLSRWWNPAVEDQCTDRVYRIGQEKPVTVITPMAICPGLEDVSYDVVINRLLEKKRQLSAGIFDVLEISEDDISEFIKAHDNTLADNITIEEIDTFEPLEFEKFIQNDLIKHKLIAKKTPYSGDEGVDMVVTNQETKSIALLEIKHTTSENTLDHKPILKLFKASSKYGESQKILFLVTNKEIATKKCQDLAKKYNVNLIMRDDLLNLSTRILKELQ